LSDLGWEISHDSDVIFDSSGETIAGGGGWGGCTVAGAWEVGNVTVVLTGNCGKGCGWGGTVLVRAVPV